MSATTGRPLPGISQDLRYAAEKLTTLSHAWGEDESYSASDPGDSSPDIRFRPESTASTRGSSGMSRGRIGGVGSMTCNSSCAPSPADPGPLLLPSPPVFSDISLSLITTRWPPPSDPDMVALDAELSPELIRLSVENRCKARRSGR